MLLPRIGPLRSALRKTGIRRALIAASAAILLSGPTTAVATAAPDQTPGMPAELVAALARDLKISPAEYLRRAELAQEVAAFATTAQRRYPAVFAGSWLDQAGKPVIAIADGPRADEAEQAAKSAGFGVENVAKSEAVLRGEKSAFERWLEDQPEAVRAQVRGAVVDTVNNTIAVRVDQAGLPMPSFIDPARVLVTAPPVAGEKTTLQAGEIAGAQGALAGGDGYASISGDESLRCSLGFNGIDRNGDTVNITAGHCNPDIPSAGSTEAAAIYELHGNDPGARLGVFQKSVLGAQDYSIVRIDDQAESRFANNAVRVPGAGAIAIEGVAIPVIGAPVCKSGTRTGFSCGVINAVDQTVQVGERQLTQSFSANICALPGDSGGPVVTGRLALGISSASTVAQYPVCAIPNLLGVLTGDVPQLFVQPVHVVLSDNPGLRVRTS
ncbi:S1 family peptidase [Nocardia sp. 004]|uniref:S1 family peptidase n=1 Tax=Nocardia sp. 004 TaxID=3385978 RepID=UPI0039A21E2D